VRPQHHLVGSGNDKESLTIYIQDPPPPPPSHPPPTWASWVEELGGGDELDTCNHLTRLCPTKVVPITRNQNPGPPTR
jgi:hypothetical protein